jgi:hypothetical protein
MVQRRLQANWCPMASMADMTLTMATRTPLRRTKQIPSHKVHRRGAIQEAISADTLAAMDRNLALHTVNEVVIVQEIATRWVALHLMVQ